MLEPIKALLASSFSKKGINAAATETNCFGETSIKCTSFGFKRKKSPSFLQETKSRSKEPSAFKGSFA